jgi:non-heme chloroperoxidase
VPALDRWALPEFLAQLSADRPSAIKTFLDHSYNIDLLGGIRVSDQAWQNSFHVAIGASAVAALGCATAWQEDFRADLAGITVPVLVVQGGQDRIMPPDATGNRCLLPYARHLVIPDGPHAIIWTHASEVNRALLDFIRALLALTRTRAGMGGWGLGGC